MAIMQSSSHLAQISLMAIKKNHFLFVLLVSCLVYEKTKNLDKLKQNQDIFYFCGLFLMFQSSTIERCHQYELFSLIWTFPSLLISAT